MEVLDATPTSEEVAITEGSTSAQTAGTESATSDNSVMIIIVAATCGALLLIAVLTAACICRRRGPRLPATSKARTVELDTAHAVGAASATMSVQMTATSPPVTPRPMPQKHAMPADPFPPQTYAAVTKQSPQVKEAAPVKPRKVENDETFL